LLAGQEHGRTIPLPDIYFRCLRTQKAPVDAGALNLLETGS